MRFLVLGSAAGGGFPQWNCLCPNCRLAWERDPRTERRSQASLAVSGDGERWLIFGATPDLRQQIIDAPALHPRRAPRHTPIAGVFLPNGDIDNIAGLLTLREMQPFTIWGSEATLAHVTGGVFAVVNDELCPREIVRLDAPLDAGLGFTVTPFSVPGKVPLYSEPKNDADLALGAEGETTLGLEILGAGKRAYYIPSCARMTERLAARLDGADLVLFDGTTFEDDEMIALGLSHKTAWRMGHMAMNGERGSLAAFAPLKVARKVYIHINNSNPALIDGSPERARVEAAGWSVARDGLTIDLGGRGMIADDCRPRLPRGVRLREDKVRDRWVLLAPERVVKVNPIAVEILKLCDGERSLADIVGGLAARFNADPARVATDVRALLVSLQEKRMAEL